MDRQIDWKTKLMFSCNLYNKEKQPAYKFIRRDKIKNGNLKSSITRAGKVSNCYKAPAGDN